MGHFIGLIQRPRVEALRKPTYKESNLLMKLQQPWANHWWSAALALAILIGWGVTTAKAQTIVPTPTPIQATVLYNTTLRAGPGAAHAVVSKVRAGQMLTIAATSPDGHWYQIKEGEWIAAFFVARSARQATPATAPTAPRRLIATATAPLSATQTVTATPSLRSLSATARPTITATLRAPLTATMIITTGITAVRNANLRAGPGTNYATVGGVRAGQTLDLQGRTGDSTWFQLRDGSWIAAFLVAQSETVLPTVALTVIAGIPTAVPTATPPPPPVVPTAENTSLVANSPETAPVAAVEPTAPPNNGTTTFVVTRRQLLNAWENGGSMDGPSVHCGLGRSLVVNVLDENGNRINGVAVQAEYGAKEIHVTGAQGKGDGNAEFVLGGGQDVKVVRDADGSPVSSEAATGLSTDPRGIDQASLISAGYCQDNESCRTFVNNLSCFGHYSWTVTFERRR